MENVKEEKLNNSECETEAQTKTEKCEDKKEKCLDKLKAECEKLKKSKESAEALADEYKDKWMRNVAEFDNYKKRNAKLWQDAYAEGTADVILKILPVGDNLDFALNMELDEKTLEGLKNIKKQFTETLKTLNVEEIDPTGEAFDPNVAEAVMQVAKEDGEESDTVKQVFLKGYRLNEKVIRYAKVSVIK